MSAQCTCTHNLFAYGCTCGWKNQTIAVDRLEEANKALRDLEPFGNIPGAARIPSMQSAAKAPSYGYNPTTGNVTFPPKPSSMGTTGMPMNIHRLKKPIMRQELADFDFVGFTPGVYELSIDFDLIEGPLTTAHHKILNLYFGDEHFETIFMPSGPQFRTITARFSYGMRNYNSTVFKVEYVSEDTMDVILVNSAIVRGP